MKKFLSALMAIVLAISTALAASAAFDSRTAENSTVEIPTLYFDSAEAYERHLNQLKSDVFHSCKWKCRYLCSRCSKRK